MTKTISNLSRCRHNIHAIIIYLMYIIYNFVYVYTTLLDTNLFESSGGMSGRARVRVARVAPSPSYIVSVSMRRTARSRSVRGRLLVLLGTMRARGAGAIVTAEIIHAHTFL